MEAKERYARNERLAYYVLSKRFPWLKSDEDAKQTAFLGLWKACLKYDASRGVPFAGYAKRVIRRELIDMLRKMPDYNHVIIGCVRECEMGWIDKSGFLEHLTEKQRKVVELSEAGYHREEIGMYLGISAHAVGAALRRARCVFDECI